jgi:soluble P-type ATPase
VLQVAIPGHGRLHLKHLVLDYNGTIAVDGEILPGVRRRLNALSRRLNVHVLTADTFGKASRALADTPFTLSILSAREQDKAKRAYVDRLGARYTVCIGNGRNDQLMLKAAALGIVVVQREGAAVAAVTAADIVMPGIKEALELLDHPLRLAATLRY